MYVCMVRWRGTRRDKIYVHYTIPIPIRYDRIDVMEMWICIWI